MSFPATPLPESISHHQEQTIETPELAAPPPGGRGRKSRNRGQGGQWIDPKRRRKENKINPLPGTNEPLALQLVASLVSPASRIVSACRVRAPVGHWASWQLAVTIGSGQWAVWAAENGRLAHALAGVAGGVGTSHLQVFCPVRSPQLPPKSSPSPPSTSRY